MKALHQFIEDHRQLVVLTGAGISVGCGIPTYRDEDGVWQRSEPITHQEFVNNQHYQRRYWLRSFHGWPAVSSAQPSASHYALAELERKKRINLLVTQNVDRLHQRAGSMNVIDLHGRLDEVICLECGASFERQYIQMRLEALNPFLSSTGAQHRLAPDGDADAPDHLAEQVTLAACDNCDGCLMPNVVFFGGTVDRDIVNTIYRAIEESDGLLVVGSSLQVFSGYRFVRHAANVGTPVASVNPGKSRGDELFQLTVKQPSDRVLPDLAAVLSS